MGKVHALKCTPEPFKAVCERRKMFEFRKDDRHFMTGDVLWLQEYVQTAQEYTGKDCRRVVGYIARGPDFGIPEGYCVMSIDREPPVSR